MKLAETRRVRLSYANVMATLAFFVAIGGGAWAVTIGRNDVGARQIAKNAVGTSELKNDKTKGEDVDEASLSQVPSAVTADRANTASAADTANAAVTAANAGTVGGLNVRNFNLRQSNGAVAQSVLDLGGLQIRMSCGPGNLTATTTKDNSSIFVWGIDTGFDTIKSNDLEGQDFDLGDAFDIDANMGSGSFGGPDLGTLLYENSDGTAVTVDLVTDFNPGGGADCEVAGTAVGG
jgi:hypothetical protein